MLSNCYHWNFCDHFWWLRSSSSTRQRKTNLKKCEPCSWIMHGGVLIKTGPCFPGVLIERGSTVSPFRYLITSIISTSVMCAEEKPRVGTCTKLTPGEPLLLLVISLPDQIDPQYCTTSTCIYQVASCHNCKFQGRGLN